MVEVKTIPTPPEKKYDPYGTETSPGGYGGSTSFETALSPGQTAGTVAGEQIVRPEGTPITEPYYDLPRAGSARTPPEFMTRDVAERGMRIPVQTEPVSQPVPTPFQIGFVGQGRLYQAIEERRLQQQYPSTPIDYSRTHVSELYSYPLYKGAAFVSRGLQTGLERGIDILPEPEPIKEAQKGLGSVFTGIPEFFASGVSGWEYAAREPRVFKTGIVPAAKMFGAGFAEQATTRPFYTGGQAVGFVAMMRGGLSRGQPKLLESPKIGPFKAPTRELLPQVPKGMEGLQLLRLPERPGIYKPIVIEGVKTIREPSAIPEQYRAALAKGSAPISERGVMGMQFGSRGYRPTSVAKPENIFSTGEFKKFLKEEKGVSYIPTFERLKAEPQIKPRVSVMTAEKTYVLPSLRNLQVVKTAPKTSFKIAVLPKTSTRTAVMTDIFVQTRPKIFTQAMTRTATRTGISIKPFTKTMIMPATMTGISVMPAIKTRTALKQLTQPQTRTMARTQIRTAFDIDVKKLTKQKTTSDIFGFGRTRRKGRRGGFKFPELTRVATPHQIMKGFRL